MRTGRQTAFTLVELMIAIIIAVIVTTGIYAAYTNYVKAFIAQDRVVETQQTARVAIDGMTQDLLRAGYKVPDLAPAVVAAAASDITLELFNEQARDVATLALAPQLERIRYYVDGSNRLWREVYRQTGSPLVWSATRVDALSGVLAENVQANPADPTSQPALRFAYITETAFLSNPTSPAELSGSPAITDPAVLRQIRQVRVTLTVRSAQKDPVRNDFVYRTLRADVKPRNAGLMASVKDNDVPAVPTGLQSHDWGNCSVLYLSWNENTEADLAGYTIYYGTDPGALVNRVNVTIGIPHAPAAENQPGPYPLTGLQNGIQYYLAIAAFDTSGNEGPRSTLLYGTTGTADTQPDVADPDSGPGVVALAGGASRIDLSWTKVNEPDVVGYNVYRKTTAFSDGDLDLLGSGGIPAGTTQVADYSSSFAVSGSTVAFADTRTDLKGCIDYYYAVSPVKGCRSGNPPTVSYVHPQTTYSRSLFGRGGGGRSTDTTPPDAATLTADSSYLRNYLNVTNPSNPDFVYSLVAYRTGSGGAQSNWPSFTKDAAGTISTNGTFVECRTDPNGPGAFTGPGGPISFTHTGEPCIGTYNLSSTTTYYYTVVAVDTCKNLSTYTEQRSQPSAQQCGDEVSGDGVGNPPPVTGVKGVTRPLEAGVSEARLTWNATPDGPSQVRDHAGYYVYRTSSLSPGSPTLPATPGIGDREAVKGLLLNPNPAVYYRTGFDTRFEENTVQKVRILSVDCDTVVNERMDTRYTSANFDGDASQTLVFYPGRLQRDVNVDTRAAGKYYNTLAFSTTTTMHEAATSGAGEKVPLQQLTFDWTTSYPFVLTTRRLKFIDLSIDGGVSWVRKTLGTPLASPAVVDAVSDAGVRMGVKTGPRQSLWRLTFYDTNDGGNAGSKADMRRIPVDMTVVYQPIARVGGDASPLVAMDTAQTATVTFAIPAVRGPDIGTPTLRRTGTSDAWPATTAVPPAAGSVTFPYHGSGIEVLASVTDNVFEPARRGLDSVVLYYSPQPRTSLSAPPFGSAFPTTIDAAYAPVPICDSVSGGAPDCTGTATYTGLIPATADQRVWFFVVVFDKAGNYGVWPAQETVGADSAGVYDMEPAPAPSPTPTPSPTPSCDPVLGC